MVDVGGDEMCIDFLCFLCFDFGIVVRGDDSGVFLYEVGGECEIDI